METKVLSNEYEAQFLEYCKKYGAEHDPSFLTSMDMQGQDFTDVEKNPTVVLIEDEKVIGVISLMTYMSFSEETTKYRMRIMHSTCKPQESYKLMWDHLMTLDIEFDQIYLFIPESEKPTHMDKILKELAFKIERISFILMNREKENKAVELPRGYTIRPVDVTKELEVYASVRNECFKHLLGARAKVGADFIPYIESKDYIEDSMMFLEANGEVVGFLAVGPDEDDKPEEAGIGGIGLLESQRGKGLGKALLRHGVTFLKDRGFTDIWLSVNGENDAAIRLYLKEGFVMEEKLTCYIYNK